MIIINPYFDSKNIEQPVQYYTDNLLETNINFNEERNTEIFIGRTDYKLFDNYWMSSQTKEGEFYSAEVKSVSYERDRYLRSLISINFNLDSKTIQIERQVNTMFKLVGEVGGIFEIVDYFGVVIFGFFYNKLIIFYLINSLIKVENSQGYLKKRNSPIEIRGEDGQNLENPSIKEEKIQRPELINTPKEEEKEFAF